MQPCQWVCTATQALLASSHLYHEVQKNAASHGVIVDGARIDITKMMAQKEKAVSGLTKGVEGLFKKYKARSPCGSPMSGRADAHSLSLHSGAPSAQGSTRSMHLRPCAGQPDVWPTVDDPAKPGWRRTGRWNCLEKLQGADSCIIS